MFMYFVNSHRALCCGKGRYNTYHTKKQINYVIDFKVLGVNY